MLLPLKSQAMLNQIDICFKNYSEEGILVILKNSLLGEEFTSQDLQIQLKVV